MNKLLAALRELVAVRDLAESREYDDRVDFSRRTGPAWEAARLAIREHAEAAEPEAVAADLERAFQVLEVSGVSRARARSVANGIMVLEQRYNKEIQSLRAALQATRAPDSAPKSHSQRMRDAGFMRRSTYIPPEEDTDSAQGQAVDPRLSKLFGAACRVCMLHDHELGEPSRAEAIEILREVVNSMSPLRAEQGQAVAWRTAGIGEKPDCVQCGHVCTPPSAPEPAAPPDFYAVLFPDDDRYGGWELDIAYATKGVKDPEWDKLYGEDFAKGMCHQHINAALDMEDQYYRTARLKAVVRPLWLAAPLPPAGRPVTPCTCVDGERYRWLREHTDSQDDLARTLEQEGFTEFVFPTVIQQRIGEPEARTLDAAIDAARGVKSDGSGGSAQ